MTKTPARKPGLKPFAQGHLDSLCGLYAVMNAMRVLLDYRPGRIPNRVLFGEIIRIAARMVPLREALTRGIEPEALWRITLSLLRSTARNRLIADRPFEDMATPKPTALGRAITAGTKHEGTVWIVGLAGPWPHWSVVRSLSARGFAFHDSGGLKSMTFDADGREISPQATDVECRLEGRRIIRLRLAHRVAESLPKRDPMQKRRGKAGSSVTTVPSVTIAKSASAASLPPDNPPTNP